jgi:Fe-S oxidoreductase
MDVRDFMAKLKRDSIDAAFKTFRNAVQFPAIVASLCPGPCGRGCPGEAGGDAIRIRELEAFVLGHARSLEPIPFNLPVKPDRIAVVGAGVGGLACAIRLAAKKYRVAVYERSARIGGHLWDLLSPDLFLADIERQGRYAPYDLYLDRDITSLAELEFDAVFIATGKGGAAFGLDQGYDSLMLSNGRPGCFLGGGAVGADTVWAIEHGCRAAMHMEKYLKTGSMGFDPERRPPSRLDAYCQGIVLPRSIAPAGAGGFGREEARAEAGRCQRCDCDACMRNCDFMQYVRKTPTQIANAVHYGLTDSAVEPKSSNRLVNSCDDCGSCGQCCPLGIATGAEVLAARQAMQEKGLIPSAYHDYWLRDMEHAWSDDSHLFLPPEEGADRHYQFFPGCQLGASDPRYPEAGWQLLRRAYPGSGLLLACCGAPAAWAGEAELHRQVLDRLAADWEAAGQPVLVCACPTCMKQLARGLPQINTISLYQALAERPELRLPTAETEPSLALFDPCSAKEAPRLRDDVTALLRRMRVPHHRVVEDMRELPCCGFGGNIEGASPELAEIMARKRIETDAAPYVTYCANCRDRYAALGKPTLHVIDLLCQLHGEFRPAPHLSDRRPNRELAKARLLDAEPPARSDSRLRLAGQVLDHMDRQLLTAEDVRRVIAHAEATGSRFQDEDGVFIAHLDLGVPTVWVEYRVAGDAFDVLQVYAHRMKLDEPGRERSLGPEGKRRPHWLRS